MLFSNDELARFLNQNFEPAWETLRPVPIVRIDFGNGRVITRTLHGNIASYVCAADGNVVDILPGMYTAEAYRTGLDRIRTVSGGLPADRDARKTALQNYHRTQVTAIRAQRTAAEMQRIRRDVGKGIVERPVERLLANNIPAAIARPNGTPNGSIPVRNLAAWQALADDTRNNETQRRLQIHDKLAAEDPAQPEQMKVWLYKNVLNADLTDPYLGLGDVLIDGDPFQPERRPASS